MENPTQPSPQPSGLAKTAGPLDTPPTAVSTGDPAPADSAPNRSVARGRLLATSSLTHLALASGGVLPAICLVQIASQFDLSDSRCGLLFATGPVVTLLTLPLAGILGERWGKRGLLTFGMVLYAAGLALFRTAPDYGLLLAGMATMGLAGAIIDALVSPLVVDLYPLRTAPVMNLVHACFQIGLVVTSIGGGAYLACNGPWREAFWPSILIAALMAILFGFTRFPPALKRGSPIGLFGLLGQRSFWLCAMVIASAGGVEAGVISWTPSFLQRQFDLTITGNWLTHHLGLSDAAPLLGGLGVALFAGPMILGRLYYGSIAERYGHITILMTSCMVSAAALAALGQSTTATGSVICLAIVGVALSGIWPTILTYSGTIIHANPPTLFSLMAMAGLLGVSGCSWAIGQLADSFGLQAGLSGLLLPMVASGLALVILHERELRAKS